MKQTLFLGIATVSVAIGATLATRQHLYSAYSLFVAAVLMVLVAIWVSYWKEYRVKRGKKELGAVLVELSQCELAAHNGTDGRDYDAVLQRIEVIKRRVALAAKYLDESSVEARFLAVNVLDTPLDEATKLHFLARTQGDFWAVYQKIKGWRACVEKLLQEAPRT